MSFVDEWRAVDADVRRFCMRSVRDHDLADEVLQQTRIRAWRGYSSFQRRSSFLTWALTIARREVAREMGRQRRFVPIESIPEPVAPDAPPAPPSAEGFAAAIEHAIEHETLTPSEAQVVRARLASPDAGWTQIAAALGASPGHCAVLHFRAMAKLRVFLFRFHADRLGGRAEIERAFAAAGSASPARRLSHAEASAFKACVLAGEPPRRGDLEALRSACVKVALQLELP